MLWKCCTQYACKLGKLNNGLRTGKGQSSLKSQRKAVAKDAQTTTQLYSSHTLVKCCSKFKLGFNNRWTMNFQMFKLDLQKAEEQRSRSQHLLDHWKSKRVPEKHLFLLYWLCQSLWLCRSQQTGKFFKRWKYQTTWPASWEICMHVRKQQLELDMDKQTGCKSGQEYIKAVYCHPAYLTYMQSTSWETPG